MSDAARTTLDWGMDSKGRVHCDGFGCDEWHPIEHECLGEPSFGTGRWLGWLYLDLNRPDLFERPMRFCSVRCCLWWLDKNSVNHNLIASRSSRELTPFDLALRAPEDAVARKRAGLGSAPASTPTSERP